MEWQQHPQRINKRNYQERSQWGATYYELKKVSRLGITKKPLNFLWQNTAVWAFFYRFKLGISILFQRVTDKNSCGTGIALYTGKRNHFFDYHYDLIGEKL